MFEHMSKFAPMMAHTYVCVSAPSNYLWHTSPIYELAYLQNGHDCPAFDGRCCGLCQKNFVNGRPEGYRRHGQKCEDDNKDKEMDSVPKTPVAEALTSWALSELCCKARKEKKAGERCKNTWWKMHRRTAWIAAKKAKEKKSPCIAQRTHPCTKVVLHSDGNLSVG